ncbi:MAG: hypothetical protein QNK36_11500 [Colwellia sp.]|nr:hypothetical protein [Colwellia sp.]
MLKIKHNLYSLIIFTIMSLQTSVSLAEDRNIEVSGFARVVAGIASNDSVIFNDYDNQIQFGEESLIAVQVDGQLTDKISATGQLLYHPADNRESGVEWAYLTYQHNHKLNFKLGKLRTPFFQYSDVIDVGVSYPWISPPGQVYKEYMFSTFEGVKATYHFAGERLAYSLEGYWGQFDSDVSTNGNKFATTVDDLQGGVFTIVDDSLSYRVSYHRGFVELDSGLIDAVVIPLSQLGFDKSAQSLSTRGDIKFYQASMTYDGLSYFTIVELIKITGDISLVPQATAAYATFGYYFHPFTAHLTIATNNSNTATPVNEIPSGVSPQLDQLMFGYKTTINALNNADLDTDSLSIGLRWDVKANLALKVDLTTFKSKLPASLIIIDSTSKDNRTNLLQVGLEWVF